jgi:hypothetical protein
MEEEADLGVVQTIRDFRGRDPFVPFRVVMSSGDGYTVEASELLAIARSQLIYCFPHSDRVAHLRMNQIAAIEELNGKSAKRTRKRAK